MSRFADPKYRWLALFIIALGLAIVIIDNTVLNVSVPYIIRDLHTDISSIEWVISGYALTIATILITVGRIGDIWGRKRLFRLGIVIFAVGSLIGSFAGNATTLIIGRSIIQAIGAAMALTSALALVATNFHGSERALAFGIWGSVAGASASIGPLLGGYLTTYASWRWSLRINVFVGILALLGSVFIIESKGEGSRKFDIPGTFLSGAALFTLVFGIIEGNNFGWLKASTATIFGAAWPFTISVVPFIFIISVIFFFLFIKRELALEKTDRHPLFRMSMFRNRDFTFGLLTLSILAFSLFGVFFLLPIYLENVLGLDALGAGIALLASSASTFIFGTLSGYLASRTRPRYFVIAGMTAIALGVLLLYFRLSTTATALTIAPALICFGIGIGMGSAQLSNIVLSSASTKVAGEASAAATTVRQIGASVGVAILGAVFAGAFIANASSILASDASITPAVRQDFLSHVNAINIGSGNFGMDVPHEVKNDIDNGLVDAVKKTLLISLAFVFVGVGASLFISGPESARKSALGE